MLPLDQDVISLDIDSAFTVSLPCSNLLLAILF